MDSWFHDKISRKDAEKLLVESGNQLGAFIVRGSESVPGLKYTIFEFDVCNI